MFGVQALCDHILGFRHQAISNCTVEPSLQRHRVSPVGSRWASQGRTLRAMCSSSGSNSGCFVRAAAVTSTTNAQVACETSSVQELLAQVVQKRSRRVQQQLQKHHPSAHAHAVELQDVPDVVLVDNLDHNLRRRLAAQAVEHQPLEQQQQLLQLQHDQWQLLDSYHYNHNQESHHHQQQRDNQQPAVDHQLKHTLHRHAAGLQLEQHVLHATTAGHQLPGTDGLHQHPQQSWQSDQNQNSKDQQVDLLLQECAALLDSPQQVQQQQVQQLQQPVHSSPRTKVSGSEFTRQELLQGWRYCPRDQVDRTAAGTALLRLSTTAQPARLAKQLLMWLRREQQVVLSAAGTHLAYQALQCLSELQVLVMQQQPHCQLLCAVEARSSRRPEGRGRCDVYNMTCTLQHRGQKQQQQQKRQLSQQQSKQPQSVADQQGIGSASHCSINNHNMGSKQRHGQRQQQAECHQQHHGQQQVQLQVAEQATMSLQWVMSGDAAAAAAHGAGLLQHVRANLDSTASSALLDQQQQQHVFSDALHQSCSVQMCLKTSKPASHTQRHQRLQLGPERSCSSKPWQQSVSRLKTPQQRRAEQQQQQQPAPAGLSAADSSTVTQQVDVSGSPSRIADVLDSRLQGPAVVLLPIAYPKQAAKLLQAASLLNRSWTAQQQRRQQQVEGGGSVQLVLQVWPGTVQRQSGSKCGLHVFVFAAPLVQ